jgi:hypothetical protein
VPQALSEATPSPSKRAATTTRNRWLVAATAAIGRNSPFLVTRDRKASSPPSGPPRSGPDTASGVPAASQAGTSSGPGFGSPAPADGPGIHPGSHQAFGPHSYSLADWAAALLRFQLHGAGTAFGGASPLSALAGTASLDVARANGSGGGFSSSSGSLPANRGAPGSGAAGIASSALFALLVSFTAFALWHLARLLLTPARWRPQAFVAVLERPG